MKKITILLLVVMAGIAVQSCKDNPSSPEPSGEASGDKQFVWNAMNYWYCWQGDVDELADSFDDDSTAFQQYLKRHSDAEDLYDDLKFRDDRFSFFVDDYEEYLQERSGVHAALGFNYNFFWKTNAQKELVVYVRYVIPDSSADDAGLKRLDLFTKVDGTPLITNNYLDLLTDNKAHELTLAHIESTGGTLSFKEDSTVSIASKEVREDPVFKSKVIDTVGVNIGYLMYNSFQRNSHKRLNEVFGDFKSEGVDQLVLDLRYNGGGAVVTSQLLSSMISDQGCSDVFAEYDYNQKRSEESNSIYFLDEVPLQDENGDFFGSYREGQCFDYNNTIPLNRLSLNKVYVLVSNATASASEALINGLRPYIDVTVIGTQTIGKDQAALLLFDAPPPYTDDDKANEEHTKAIQPIVSKFTNADDETYPYEYTNGNDVTINTFIPDGYDPTLNDGNGGCPMGDNN